MTGALRVNPVILNFHGVGDPVRTLGPGEAAVWLSRRAFEEALDAVAGRDDVRLTFDDGNLSDLTIALPELVRRGLRAAFFLPAGLLGRRGYLEPAHVRELVLAGMRVGNHGMRHRAWRGLPEAALHEELVGAREILERAAGVPVREAACPFGEYDRRSLARLREAGYERVYTSDRGRTNGDPWLLPRNTVHADDGSAGVLRILEERPTAIESIRRSLLRAVKRWR